MDANGDIVRLLDPNLTLAVFVLFCRIGGCLMLMPGWASAQIPVQVRLFVAVATTLSPKVVAISGSSWGLARASCGSGCPRSAVQCCR